MLWQHLGPVGEQRQSPIVEIYCSSGGDPEVANKFFGIKQAQDDFKMVHFDPPATKCVPTRSLFALGACAQPILPAGTSRRCLLDRRRRLPSDWTGRCLSK